MAFKLDSVVPWGRNLEEYKLMFGLDDSDMSRQRGKIIEPLFFDRSSYFLNQLFSPKKSNESKA